MKSIWDTRFSTSKARTFSEALKRSGWAFDGWVTMNGSRVLLGEEGEILGGLGGAHNGENVKDLKKSDNSTQEKPAQSTTTVEKPVLSSNRAEAEEQIRQYIEAKRMERYANGERPNIAELQRAGKDKEVAAAKAQIIADDLSDDYSVRKDWVTQHIPPCKPGALTESLTKDQEIERVGHPDGSGACASVMAVYVAVDKLGLDAQDRAPDSGVSYASGDMNSITMISNMAEELVKRAGGHITISAEKENDAFSQAYSTLKTMETGKEYAFLATVTGYNGHIAIARKVEKDGKAQFQFLELQKFKPSSFNGFPPGVYTEGIKRQNANGWKTLDDKALAARFNLNPNPVGAGTNKTASPVITGIIDTEKLANSKEFQEMLPYINGKPKTK